MLLQIGSEFDAVRLPQPDIEKRDLGIERRCRQNGLARVVRGRDGVVARFEQFAEGMGEVDVVVDDEDAAACVGVPCSAKPECIEST